MISMAHAPKEPPSHRARGKSKRDSGCSGIGSRKSPRSASLDRVRKGLVRGHSPRRRRHRCLGPPDVRRAIVGETTGGSVRAGGLFMHRERVVADGRAIGLVCALTSGLLVPAGWMARSLRPGG
jgi:hypothetical protein